MAPHVNKSGQVLLVGVDPVCDDSMHKAGISGDVDGVVMARESDLGIQVAIVVIAGQANENDSGHRGKHRHQTRGSRSGRVWNLLLGIGSFRRCNGSCWELLVILGDMALVDSRKHRAGP